MHDKQITCIATCAVNAICSKFVLWCSTWVLQVLTCVMNGERYVNMEEWDMGPCTHCSCQVRPYCDYGLSTLCGSFHRMVQWHAVRGPADHPHGGTFIIYTCAVLYHSHIIFTLCKPETSSIELTCLL